MGEGREVNFAVRPCCLCICCCSRKTPFSKKKIHNLRGAVYQVSSKYLHIFKRTSNYLIFNLFQMPYVQSVMIFLIVVFELTGYLEIGDLNPKKPYLYLMSAILISFFVGLWALFVFLDVTKKYQLLHHFKYGQKAGLLKAIVILVNVQVRTEHYVYYPPVFHLVNEQFFFYFQGFVLDSLGKYNIVDCIPPHISTTTMVSIIKSILCLFESFILGSWAFRLYIVDDTHL